MAEPAAAAPKRFPWLALILAGVAFAVLIGLGTWQVERLKWKETLLATIDERIHSKPVPLAQLVKLFAETEDVDYWPVTATGVFDHAREQHFFATHDGAAGYFVYTPLVQDRGETILVNRGFVPFDFKDPATRIEGQTEGPVTVTGLARNPLDSKPSALVPNNDAAKNIYYWKDITLMAKQSGVPEAKLVPFFVDADATPNAGGLPQGGVTIIDLPNNHLQYAATWYGLAATLAGVLGIWLWRRSQTV